MFSKILVTCFSNPISNLKRKQASSLKERRENGASIYINGRHPSYQTTNDTHNTTNVILPRFVPFFLTTSITLPGVPTSTSHPFFNSLISSQVPLFPPATSTTFPPMHSMKILAYL
ncbi:hypothetical protein ACHAXS_014129 [Conticribra weissflogii]